MLITKAKNFIITRGGNSAATSYTITISQDINHTEERTNLHIYNEEEKNDTKNEEEKNFIIDIDLPNVEILDVEQD
jgi:hypothetical protein